MTNYLSNEYKKCEGFKEWFDPLWKNSLHDFFVKQRHFILKEGPTAVRRDVSISEKAEITVSSSIEIKVVRSQPWYRRRPSILWEDFVRAIKQAVKRPIGRWMSIRKAAKRRREAAKRSEPVVTVGFYFDKHEWRDRPALELLEGYLDWLETVVRDAESRFGGGIPEARQEN